MRVRVWLLILVVLVAGCVESDIPEGASNGQYDSIVTSINNAQVNVASDLEEFNEMFNKFSSEEYVTEVKDGVEIKRKVYQVTQKEYCEFILDFTDRYERNSDDYSHLLSLHEDVYDESLGRGSAQAEIQVVESFSVSLSREYGNCEFYLGTIDDKPNTPYYIDDSILEEIAALQGGGYMAGLTTTTLSEANGVEIIDGVPATATAQIHFIDVGQGDATLIQTPTKKSILIDGGNTGKGDDVVNYLKSLGVEKIDIMIATHADADHIGGLDEIMELIEVDTVYDNGQYHTTNAYADYRSLASQRELFEVTSDGLLIDSMMSIEFIVPYDNEEGINSDRNDNSIIIKATLGKTVALLTGDCEAECEDDILNDGIDADILKVGHHGSKTSSSPEFLDMVTPKVGIISAGLGNRYGHPHPEVLAEYESRNIPLYGTYESGTIVVTMHPNGDYFVE